MPPKMNRKPVVISLLMAGLLFLLSPGVFAQQEDCIAKIQEAQKLYDQGLIDQIPSMLAPCMADGFTRAQKIEAYKLIIISYLFDENQYEAERTMLEFLKKYPEYEIMPNDPVEFVYLFESYRTASIFSFGIIGGINLTDPRIIERFTTLDSRNATFSNIVKPGFQAGIGIERYIGRKVLLNLEAFFSLNHYRFLDEFIDRHGMNSVTFTEKLYKVEVPVTLSYEFTLNKKHFIARAGASAARITSVMGQPERKYYDGAAPLSSASQDISAYRKKMLYSGIVGLGTRYKVPRGIIAIDLRAEMGLNNIVESRKRYDNRPLLDRYNYLDDNFSINSLSLSIGYYFSFYSPRKQH